MFSHTSLLFSVYSKSTLSLLLDDPELFELSVLKRGMSDVEQFALTNEWKRLKKEEAEEMFTPLPEITQQLDDTFAGQLNFQYSFADDGTGQDWAVSISTNLNYIY